MTLCVLYYRYESRDKPIVTVVLSFELDFLNWAKTQALFQIFDI